MSRASKDPANVLAAAAVLALCSLTLVAGKGSNQPAINNKVSAAICPIVYPLDESSAERGYRYIFYGNAFFINKAGYLLTAAHVLSDFQNGGAPHVLLRLPEAPPCLVKVEAVASDPEHDIAILRAIPNPFVGKYSVAVLPLASAQPAPGAPVLAAAVRPTRIKDPHSFDAPQVDNSPAQVLQYVSLALNKGERKAELFIFDHEVIRGQSGAPILGPNSQEVVGLVEGQWLHGMPLAAARAKGSTSSTLGAGLPITYALLLLERHHVAWEKREESPD